MVNYALNYTGDELNKYIERSSDIRNFTFWGGDTTSSGNNYSVSSPNIDTLIAGMSITVKINATCTGASTLNWDGVGAKPIKLATGADFTGLKSGGIYTFRYDGTNFILQGDGYSGTATASDIISGKTASTDAGEVTGTLILDGTVLATDVLFGKTFYNTYPKNKLTGAMPLKGVQTYTPTTTDQTISAGQYLDGIQTILGDSDLIASNIKKGVNIFGVTGTMPILTYVGELNASYTNAYTISFNLTSYTGYGGLVVGNILPVFTTINKITTAYNCVLTWTYTAGTGVLTCASSLPLFVSGNTKAKIYVYK